jgi:YKOF-related Family
MKIGVEISLYPLNADYIPPIRNFIDRLNAAGKTLRIVTNDMSTQVFGDYDVVMPLLLRELRQSFQDNNKSVFVMKVLGPLAIAQ